MKQKILTHPHFLISLFILIINDHFLKTAGLISSDVTGKLSDFAGLFFFPAFLVYLIKVENNLFKILIYIITGCIFSLLNLSANTSEFVERMCFYFNYPIKLWPDDTDLIALVILPFSYYTFFISKAKQKSNTRHYEKIIIVISIFAVMSTSSEPEEPNVYYENPNIEYNSYTHVSKIPYEDNQFRESLHLHYNEVQDYAFFQNKIIYANPSLNRLVFIDTALKFSGAFYNNGTNFGWHIFDLEGDIIGLNAPFDFALTLDKTEILILDNNGITKRDFIFGTLIETLSLSALVECSDIVQIEYSDHLIALSKNIMGDFFICHYDEITGDFILADAISMTQEETGRAVVSIPHFKANENGIYILKELQVYYENEDKPYFLEKLSQSFVFESGVFLYDASGMSFSGDSLIVTGRQRNFEGSVTIFDFNLNQIETRIASTDSKLIGISHIFNNEIIFNSFVPASSVEISN